LNLRTKYWNNPKKKGLSASSDLGLFFETIAFIDKFEMVSKKQIMFELPIRVKGLKLIKHLSQSGIEKIIGELKAFNWIVPDRPSIEKSEYSMYRLTNEGRKALELFRFDNRSFLNLLIFKMYKEYTIPVWFIDRLWKLNPEGQGQVVIPSPIKEWNPESKHIEDHPWTNELTVQVLLSYKKIQKLSPNSFNIPEHIWLEHVQYAWERLSKLKRRKDFSDTALRNSYAPRKRLSIAMKEAAINILFNNEIPNSGQRDFNNFDKPLSSRAYMAWCPRLEELELIFYTDYNSAIPGRIIVPVCVFTSNESSNNYEYISDITNLEGKLLALHRPRWIDFRRKFMTILYRVYQENYLKTKSLYVSIQNVRDEVCRRLRLSSSCFEDFLSNVIKESLEGTITLTISIETDVREDQRKGTQLERKPVRLNGKFTSLIAITNQNKLKNG